jgi:dTDP-glucose 4,6-dehydratase
MRGTRRDDPSVSEALAADLDEILDAAADDLRHFAGTRWYVTGGTGFIGTWLLRTLAHANRRLGTNIRADVLTRSPHDAAGRAPDLAAEDRICFLQGDILAPAADGTYDAVVHAATPSTGTLNETDPERMLALIVDGTRALIRDVVTPAGAVPLLFTSSGAVYGSQPPTLERTPETYTGAPDCLDTRSAYGEGKRVAELALTIAQSSRAGRLRLARMFAFLGPGLPLDAHYAAGNFIRDALSGGPIRVAGDGTPYRSYLYPTDMVAWLLAIFARGTDGRAYNVGGEEAVTVAELAARIAGSVAPPAPVAIAAQPRAGVSAARYVPDISRVRAELQVRQSIPLERAIERTLSFHRRARASHAGSGRTEPT